VTDDKVKMYPKCPACNRCGHVLEPEIERMPFSDARGCGNLMRTLMAEELAKPA
jgi:hypothetical protein